jgi:IclR family transcriptional regulator, pca regulon regulatory protein
MSNAPRRQAPAAGEHGPKSQPVLPLPEPRYSSSLRHGLAILACFSAQRPIRGIADIADELGLSRSTNHRYITTLAALGYLEQVTNGRKYQLGTRAGDVGMAALSSLGLREPALPYLRELRIRSRCTASLAILDSAMNILYVARVRSYQPGQHEIDLGQRVGTRLPAHCTAMGKLLLAYLPEEEQHEAIKAMKLPRRTPHTIISKAMLRVELERIRERGIAINDRELTPNLHAIAAPVRAQSGEVIAAVNIAANSSRISHEELTHGLRPHLLVAADRISARLGYSGDHDETTLGQAA